MPISINNDSLSRSVQRSLALHTAARLHLSATLSSGSRINGAQDDAAGQAIASRMTAGINGATQARRNINDANSLLQVADGTLSTIADGLQRVRQLAIAAGNGSYSDSDRATLQAEADQILQQISAAGNDASFAGKAIFRPDGSDPKPVDSKQKAVVDALKASWLGSAENLVEQYYGLTGDGSTLNVNLKDSDGKYGVLASVSGVAAPGADVQLNIDMADFDLTGAGNTPDGGTGPLYDDRVVAHEMVHAIMLHSTSFNFPQWFIEGTAELIQGADERVAGAIAAGNTPQDIVDTIANGGFTYEGGYVASRYLHDKLKTLGAGNGIKDLMTYLDQHRNADLSTALKAVTNNYYADESAFLADFGAHGAAYIASRMDLANADTGAIGGLDADGGPSRDAKDVVPDVGNGQGVIMRHFKVQFPDTGGGGASMSMFHVQAGAQAGDLIGMQFSAVDAISLGLGNLDLKDTAVSLMHIDDALAAVDQQRATVGAYGNRLDIAADNLDTASTNLQASKSRIQDADFASATAQMTREQILQEAATAMLGQANGEARVILSLLH